MVRRPLFYIAAAVSASTAVAYHMGTGMALALSLIFGAFILIWRDRAGKRSSAVVLLAVAYVAGTVNFCIYSAVNGGSEVPEGRSVQVLGRVLQAEEKRQDDDTVKIAVTLLVKDVNGKAVKAREKILVNLYIDDERAKAGAKVNAAGLVAGDEIRVFGTAEEPQGRRNPGCFDYRLYLKTVGIERVMQADSMEVAKASGYGTLTGKLHVLREEFIFGLEREIGTETAAMIAGVLFGQTEGMDEDTLEEFRRNGTAHILSVSGLHIGLIYGIISRIWIWRKGYLYFALTMSFFGCYMVMASFSPPVVRAVFMVGLHLLAKVKNKRYDLESSAYLAGLSMMASNPMTLFNTGFQMSFMAILSIAVVMPVVKRFYSGVFLSGAAVQAGLLPYTAYMFNYVSLGAVVVNVPIVFISGLVVPLGLISMAVSGVSGTLFSLMAEMTGGLCRMMAALNSVTTVDGVTVFTVTSPDISFLMIYYLLLAVFLREDGRLLFMRRKRKTIIFLAAVVTAGAIALGGSCGDDFGRARAVFVDVGQGDCLHIRTEDGSNYMIDGGGSMGYSVGKQVLKPYLLKNGVRKLDGIFVTHLHTDHYRGAAELCGEGMADRLFLYEGNRIKEEKVLEETGLDAGQLTYLYGGQMVKLSEDVGVEVLWPDRRTEPEYRKLAEDEEDENGSSLVLRVLVEEKTLLMTGDIDEECQEELAAVHGSRLESDIFKVPHHGSKYNYCQKLIDEVSPRYAVFQVGKNNFGHPDKGVVENYLGQGIIVYRNDKDGAVAFEFTKDGGTRVMTVRQRQQKR